MDLSEISIRSFFWEGGPFGRRRLGAADWVPDNWVTCRLGAGHLGAVS